MVRSFSLILCCLLLLVGSIAGWTAPIRDGDPLTIGAILAQEDGTTATLTAEQILKPGRSGKSFAIKEWFEKQPSQPRLVVVCARPLPVEEYWTADVTGTLSTFSGTSRDGRAIRQRVLIVSPENVTIYCSPNGKPTMFLPIKGIDIEWANKRSLVDLSDTSTTQAASMMAMDAGTFPSMPDTLDSEPAPPAAGSRDSLKWLPDGAPVSINGAVVMASFPEFFYVEKSDRSFGIRIASSEQPAAGALVNITGALSTEGGERVVIADSVVYPDPTHTYPRPTSVGMANKALGGGAVGLFTPAIADACGLNTTGLLVRTWGKVTHVDSFDRIFYIDDGSNVAADSGRTGVKIFDTTSDILPAVDDYVNPTGVSSAEIPDGSTSSIRVLHKITPVTSSVQAGNGTISGAVTATGASGKALRVYCGSSSATATFSGDTANYSLNVPYGNHAVTAETIGYKTTTHLAAVSAGNPSVSINLTLPAIQRRLDIVASPSRVPPDGISRTTVTAILRDDEGRRIGNEQVTWNVDVGTIISQDTATDAVGEAKLVLQAPSSAGTGSVTVTCGGLSATGYAEFATQTAPTVRVTTPSSGNVVSGVVTIKLEASDTAGQRVGIRRMKVYVDGQQIGMLLATRPEISWKTFQYANGNHVIRATATDADGETGYSGNVSVTTSNNISSVSTTNGMFDANDYDPNLRTTTISAHQDQAVAWEVEIKKRGAASPTKVFSGTGTEISATWDGTDSGGNPASPGRYFYTIRAGESGGGGMSIQSYNFAIWDYLVFLRTDLDAPTALLVEGAEFPNNGELLDIVEDACEFKGYQVITIPFKYAIWDRFEHFMNVYEPQVLYIVSHGHYELYEGQDVQEPNLPLVSQFLLNDCTVWSHRPLDPMGNEYPEYQQAAQDENGKYIEDLYLTYYSPLKLVWMDTCLDGRINSNRGQLYDRYAPYDVSPYEANDLADYFGITMNAPEIGASYCGFYEISFADDRYRDLLAAVFGALKNGLTLEDGVIDTAWYKVVSILVCKINFGCIFPVVVSLPEKAVE